ENRIIVIVDDFDRVDDKTVEEVLMFIREIIDFQGISTILLMEYSKIKSDKLTDEYLQKYIDIRLDINKVSVIDIIYTFIDLGIQSDKDYSVIEGNRNLFKNDFKAILDEMESISKNRISRLENEVLEKTDSEAEKEKDENQKYSKELENELKINFKNVRLIKKIVRESLKAYYKLYINYRYRINIKEYSTFIFKMFIVKNMFIDIFDKTIKSNDFYSYLNESRLTLVKESFIKEFLGVRDSNLDELFIINKYIIAEAIINNSFDNIEFENMTSVQRKLKILDKWDEIGNLGISYLDNTDVWYKEYEVLFSLVLSDFYKTKDKDKYLERFDKIRDIIDHYSGKGVINGMNLLSIYETLIKNYRYEYCYDLISSIYKIIKNESYAVGEVNNINIIINEIRKYNIAYLVNICNVFIRLNKKCKIEDPFIDVSEMKSYLENIYAEDFEIPETELEDFECVIEILNKNMCRIQDKSLLKQENLRTQIKMV
ncbi:MAG: hypothetical protein ACRC7N_05675, partial [Clostridium sp.]